MLVKFCLVVRENKKKAIESADSVAFLGISLGFYRGFLDIFEKCLG